MKLPVCSSLLLSLGVCSPLFAIERPPSLDEKLPKETPENRAVEVDELIAAVQGPPYVATLKEVKDVPPAE